MNCRNCKWQIVAACVCALAPTLLRAEPFTFDDVDYWTGTGANRAALVIDWVENSTEPPALAWGYRWDGTATGRDMLLAIVAADDRLFAKLGDSPANPVRVFGLGYAIDDDGDFGVEDDTAFDESGIAFGSAPFFPASSTDADDYYAEGWTFGFWHYSVAPTNPYNGGNWSDINVGMAGRMLADGAWDSWTFSPTFNFSSFAENPRPAPPPLAGDFDGNGTVTTADYDLWKLTFGSVSELAADASGNGRVDAADYTIWRNNLGAGADAAAAFGFTVPEPSTVGIALATFCTFWQFFIPRRKEKLL